MNPTHYNSWTGDPCNCPWGRPKWNLSKLAGQEVNKILKAPDKAFQGPRGEEFKQVLPKVVGEDYDSLAPYIAQRWKKGDIQFHPGYRDPERQRATESGLYYRNRYKEDDPDFKVKPVDDYDFPSYVHGWNPLSSGTLGCWNKWYQARQHPLRRGVNVMDPSFTPGKMEERVNEHREALEQERMLKEDLKHGDVVHKFDNGWHVRHLTSPGTDKEDALAAEGRAMGHCLGSEEQPYLQNAVEGDIEVYSLRDKKGWPHGTWHTNPDGSIAEIHGNNNKSLSPEQHEMYEEWCEANGKDPTAVGHEAPNPNAGDAEIEIPGAEDIDTYLDHFHPWSDANYHEQAYAFGDVGEDTEIYPGEPQWDYLAGNLEDKDPKERQDFYNTIHSNGSRHYEPMRQALQDPDLEKYRKEFENNHQLHYNAAGNYIYPTFNGYHNSPNQGWQTGWDQVNQPMWTRPNERPNYPNEWPEKRPEINASWKEEKSGWRFGANPETGEGYEWNFSEPSVRMVTPDRWEDSFSNAEKYGRQRIPFIWTHNDNDINDVKLYMGYPGTYHEDIHEMHPGGFKDEEDIGGYGSVKPQSFNTGDPADRDQRIEYYTVHDPRAMGSVADALTKHFDVQNQGFENEPYRKPVSDDEYDYEMQQGRFGAFELPEPSPDYKSTREPVKPEEIEPWEKGHPGKWVGLPNGEVLSWRNQLSPHWHEDEEHPEWKYDGWPSHDAVLEALGHNMLDNDITYGQIRPDGAIAPYPMSLKHPSITQHVDALKAKHPEAHLLDQGEWKFS